MRSNLLSLATLSLVVLSADAAPTPNPKRGMISDLAGHYKQDSATFTSSKVTALSWYYSFGHYPDKVFSSKYEFVLQQFGINEKPTPDGNNFKNLKTLAQDVDRANPKYLMTFLEPAISGIKVEDAVRAWRKYILPIRKKHPKLKVGSPSVINGPGSKQWIQSFVKQCPECKFDFLDVHFYWTYSEFQNFVTSMHRLFPNKPVWVSDIGFQSSSSSGPVCKKTDGNCVAQQKKQITWMDKTSWIQRYTYRGEFRQGDFKDVHNQYLWCFLDKNGKFTEFGKWYLGVK